MLPDGGFQPGAKAMGVLACVDACRFVLDETTTRTIVDPFCGWGTVLAVANALGPGRRRRRSLSAHVQARPAPHRHSRLTERGQALAGVACRRRQKKYESPQSTPVPAAQPHASGPSPTARWAMSAEPRSMAKPA